MSAFRLGIEDELIEDYLAESRELLANIEADLLTMDLDGEIDERLVNRVFRAAHSIKGGAGFFDLVQIRELAHKIENVLDLIRCRQMDPTEDVVTVLLLGFGTLRGLIEQSPESGRVDTTKLVASLAALTVDHLPKEEKHLVTERVNVSLDARKQVHASAFDLNQVRRSCQCVYIIRYDLIHDIQRRGKTPWEVFKDLIQSGTILETFLDLGSAGTLDDAPSKQLLLEVIYASVLDPGALGQLTGIPPERVLLVQERNLEIA